MGLEAHLSLSFERIFCRYLLLSSQRTANLGLLDLLSLLYYGCSYAYEYLGRLAVRVRLLTRALIDIRELCCDRSF